MSMAVDVATMGAAFNNPAAAASMINTATAGSIVTAQAAAWNSDPNTNGTAATAPNPLYSGSADTMQAYQMALTNSHAEAQQTLSQLQAQSSLIMALNGGTEGDTAH